MKQEELTELEIEQFLGKPTKELVKREKGKQTWKPNEVIIGWDLIPEM